MKNIEPIRVKRPALLIVLSVVFALLTQIVLIETPPYHDIFYRSHTYLNSASGTVSNDEFSSPLPLLEWSNDWKRQLYLHPPGNYALSWLWIGILGDSMISLGTLSLLVGWLGIIMWHRVIRIIMDARTADAVLILTCCSLSFLWYAVMPVDAIFEFAVMPLGILGLLKFYRVNTKNEIAGALLLQGIALMFSYHFLIALALSPMLAPFKKTWGKKSVCLLLYTVSAAWIIKGLLNGAYKVYWPHWPHHNGVLALIEWYAELPIAVLHWGTPQVGELVKYLGIIAGMGLVHQCLQYLHRKTEKEKFFLLLITVLPFVIYLVLANKLGSFGHQRNFFYLLPLYYVYMTASWIRFKHAFAVVGIIGLLIAFSGVVFLKSTATHLFTTQASLYAFMNDTHSKDFECVAIETKKDYYSSNAYLQTSRFSTHRIRWFTNEDKHLICETAQRLCGSTIIYTIQDLSALCPSTLKPVANLNPQLAPWALRFLIDAEATVHLYGIPPSATMPTYY